MALSWPVGSDLTTFLNSTNLDPGVVSEVLADMDPDTEVAAAVTAFQKDSGWVPFLGVEQVRSFDPGGPDQGPIGLYIGLATMGGGRKLFLGAGLISINSLYTGIWAQDPVGTELVLGSDFWLRPQNAPYDNEPYRSIEFRLPQYGEPGSIRIDGVWGYVDPSVGIPQDVFNAVVRTAAAQYGPPLELAIQGGTVGYRADVVEEKFATGANSISGLVSKWQAYGDRVVGRYARVAVV